jgi:hypothetical protein
MLCNDDCPSCWTVKNAAWKAKIAVRQDPAQFDMKRLVGALLGHVWQHECKIIPDYMPPYPRADTRPTCQVHYYYKDGTYCGLRYSRGPRQGWGWDSYGDDLHSPELALIAISEAPPPPRVDFIIATHGK